MKFLRDLNRITEDEYRANLTGMNTFFGAVLGFVLADIDTATLRDFATLLFMVAGTVVSIIYISASPKRWMYAFMTLFLIWALPRILKEDAAEIGRLQVALLVWTAMSLFVEAIWALQRREAKKSTEPAT